MDKLKNIDRVISGVELLRECEIVLQLVRNDLMETEGCPTNHNLSPYCKKYGMKISGILNTLLEGYHQLRLKDDKE